jgi:FMNH2-dependent dimethyl sulfone monooxygenase
MQAAIADLGVAGRGTGPDASLQFAVDIVKRAESVGFDMTLIAARHLGPDLEAWTLATALAMETRTMEVMVAAHPGIIFPQMVAKIGASLDRICGGRLAVNVVNGWNIEEFETFGNGAWLTELEDRYQRMDEFVQVLKGLWTEDPFSFEGKFYRVQSSNLPLKSRRSPNPPIYAASRSIEGKRTIARYCDHWFVPDRGDFRLYRETVELIRAEISAMNGLAAEVGRKVGFGLSANVVCARTMEEADAQASKLEAHGRAARYNKSSVSALGACLVGTSDVIAERIETYEKLGIELLLLQFHPMEAGLEQFIADILPLMSSVCPPPSATEGPRVHRGFGRVDPT